MTNNLDHKQNDEDLAESFTCDALDHYMEAHHDAT